MGGGQSATICNNMVISTLCLSLLIATAAAVDVKKSKHPKLFFVSSSSTTTTLSTTTLCYSTAATSFTTTACGRKKRAIYTDPVTGKQGTMELDDLIAPQAPQGDAIEDESDASHDDLVKSG